VLKSRKNPFPHHGWSLEILTVGEVQIANFLNKSIKIKRKFQAGGYKPNAVTIC